MVRLTGQEKTRTDTVVYDSQFSRGGGHTHRTVRSHRGKHQGLSRGRGSEGQSWFPQGGAGKAGEAGLG